MLGPGIFSTSFSHCLRLLCSHRIYLIFDALTSGCDPAVRKGKGKSPSGAQVGSKVQLLWLIFFFQKTQADFIWVWWTVAILGIWRYLSLTDPLHTFWYFSKQCPEGSSGVCKLLSCKHSKVFVQQRESQLPCRASGRGKMQIAAVHRDRYIQQSPCSCSVCLDGVQASPCAGALMDTVLVQGMDLAIWTEI